MQKALEIVEKTSFRWRQTSSAFTVIMCLLVYFTVNIEDISFELLLQIPKCGIWELYWKAPGLFHLQERSNIYRGGQQKTVPAKSK